MLIENVFGDDESAPDEFIGDIVIDDFGETLLVMNGEGTHLKTYSIFEIRFAQ